MPPMLTMLALLGGWEAIARATDLPAYILPAPSVVASTLVSDSSILLPSLISTLTITLKAFVIAATGGISLAILFSQIPFLQRALYPIAVILQVTPIIAIAPLLLIYLDPADAVLVCAFLVAFFPILAGATTGLRSTDPGLLDLFRLLKASRLQTLIRLQLPAALPHVLTGLRIGGGLSLVGAVVGEIAAGTAGAGAGLAFRIVEAGYRLNIPRMFAALVLIAAAGLIIFAATSVLTRALLASWHESETPSRD